MLTAGKPMRWAFEEVFGRSAGIGYRRREIATAIIDHLPKFGRNLIIHVSNFCCQRGTELTATIRRMGRNNSVALQWQGSSASALPS
jgi:hypothetical protein